MGRVKDMDLFTLIKNFLTIYLPVQRKASPLTVTDYRIVLDQLLTFIADRKKISYLSVAFSMIDKAMGDVSSPETSYEVDNEEKLKRLYGLK